MCSCKEKPRNVQNRNLEKCASQKYGCHGNIKFLEKPTRALSAEQGQAIHYTYNEQ